MHLVYSGMVSLVYQRWDWGNTLVLDFWRVWDVSLRNSEMLCRYHSLLKAKHGSAPRTLHLASHSWQPPPPTAHHSLGICFKQGTWLCAVLHSAQPEDLQVGSRVLATVTSGQVSWEQSLCRWAGRQSSQSCPHPSRNEELSHSH